MALFAIFGGITIKIAIIGAGISGLACARECERLGVIPDVFERDNFVGWIWPSVSLWLNVFEPQMGGDIREHLLDKYNIDLKPISECRSLTMKSPGQQIKVDGKLGYLIPRGTVSENSIERQLLKELKQTAVHFNRPADYKELSKKYDFVVVANGKDTPAKEMGVWQEYGQVHIRGSVAVGDFREGAATLYWNTEYAGSGYARVTPFSFIRSIVGLYYIGQKNPDMEGLFTKFIEQEGLAHFEHVYKLDTPLFFTGIVSTFRVGNVLLVGRSAGLTERLMGSGGISAMISGVLAARAMIKDMDYEEMVKPLQDHIENISAFRKPVEGFNNQGYDRLLKLLGTPGIKQIIYQSGVNFADTLGGILRVVEGRNQGQHPTPPQ